MRVWREVVSMCVGEGVAYLKKSSMVAGPHTYKFCDHVTYHKISADIM